MIIKDSQLINTKTACARLGISAKTLRRWCSEGRLSYYTTAGGHKRFCPQAIQEFLEKNFVKGDD